MDKCSVNQQIVLMRNVVKNARRNIYLQHRLQATNLRKKIKEIPKDKVKILKKMHSRLRCAKESLPLIKQLSVDTISKEALKATEPWENVLKDPKASREQKVIARIANWNGVQKYIKKFREEHQDWELYLSTLLELWDEKKKLKQNIPSEEDNEFNRKNNKQAFEPSASKSNRVESRLKSARSDKSKMKQPANEKPNKRIKFAIESEIAKEEDGEWPEGMAEEDSDNEDTEDQLPNDDFFINKKSLFPNAAESKDESESNSLKTFKPKFRNQRNEGKGSGSREKWNKHKDNNNENETVHPSWEAKKKQKQILKIDLNSSQSKKIRFTD